ncbi:MAG TPA: xanthine dehydrogenase family protein, partial [Methylomirabilota bacterium]|nr:xanthine dehydrogenase family protein [Methylomirabilota bacterium]
MVRPGTAHLGVVRAVHAHARVHSLGLAAVRRRPGVLAAWGAAELTDVAPTISAAWGGTHKGRPFAVPILASERVRYVGEPVAVVVAEDAPRLADALEAVRVEYEPLPALASVETARASATRLHEGWADNTTLPVVARIGDADTAFAQAEVVVGGRFRHPRLAATPIETRGAIAWREAETGTLVIWASIQNPYRLRDALAGALALPAESVRVLVPDVGGGFGPKGDVYPDEILVAAAALRLGRPVRWSETRREDFMALGHDREQVHDARIGLTGEGRIVALETSFLADVGAYPAQGDGLTLNTVNHLPGPYRVPAYRGSGSSVVTTKTLNAAYRAAGRPEAVFVMERLMDLAARRLGLDPAELRRRNLVRPAEMPYRPGLTYKDGVPVTYDPGDFPAAFERALELLDYDGWRRRQKAQTAGAC